MVLLIAGISASAAVQPGQVLEVHVDFGRTNGTLRPLHGINRGPLVGGGLIDLTAEHRRLNIPFTRLHDSHWPNSDVVDIHAVFPDFTRDATRAESFDFGRTDLYVAGVRRTGSQVVYRLGETIEHDTIKKRVHPPSDPNKWAEICLGIIRHYNEGWANGAQHDIRYWEIWNEPENRPVCWTGTDEQFLALYAAAARRIKETFPRLKVGGPGFGYTGDVRDGRFEARGLVTNFLAFCRRESLPLDFLSWHCYTDDPRELVLRARGIRELLDAYGFKATESHLNEWNYLPGKNWTPISRTGPPSARRATYREMAGEAGAAFIISALIELQDAPVDMANLFHGETGPFGMFDVNGVPEKNYFALAAFAELLQAPRRVWSRMEGGHAAAGINDSGTEARILVSNSSGVQSALRVQYEHLLPRGNWRASVRVVDAAHDLGAVTDAIFGTNTVAFTLRRSAVALISLKRDE